MTVAARRRALDFIDRTLYINEYHADRNTFITTNIHQTVTTSRSELKNWLIFLYLGCLGWGTSFLWIKIALREVGPVTLIFYRILFGAIAAWILVYALGPKTTLTKRQWIDLGILGLINSSIPMTLISFAEIHISSGLAGMLNGTMPLFMMVIAHYFIPGDRMTKSKVFGLMIGFVGMLALLFDDLEHGLSGSTLGILAMLVAVLAYGAAGTLTKLRLQGIPPLTMSAVALSVSLVYQFAFVCFVEWPLVIPSLPVTWVALLWMGILGMALAFYALYYLFSVWPATRISTVTYIFPVWSVLLGVVFLSEVISWKFIAGGLLVIVGIWIANRKHFGAAH